MSDWIKMRTDLYRHPKVLLIADDLLRADSELALFVSQNLRRDMTVTRNVMRNVTVGALVTVWGTLRHRGKRIDDALLLPGVTDSVVDDIADLPGFGAAMRKARWLLQTKRGLIFPRFFADHNVDPSAENNRERQRRFREKQRNVTVTLRNGQSRERVEKEKENKNPPFIPPSVDDVRAYCQERNNTVDAQRFVDYYGSNGWIVGRTKMKDWQAAVRTWEKNTQTGLFANGKPTRTIHRCK